MPRQSVIATHPKYEEIRKDIVSGTMTYVNIAKKYGVSYAAVRRFISSQLPSLAAESQKMREWDADRIVQELEQTIEYAQKLLDACDEWLTDPDAPDRYTLVPRAHEVEIVYYEQSGEEDRPVKKKASLQELLDELKEGGVSAFDARWKVADPRRLLLDAVGRLGAQIEVIAKTRGEIKDVTYTIAHSEVWLNFQTLILQELKDYPEAREQLASRLRASITAD